MGIDPADISLDEQQQKELAQVAEQTGKPWPQVFSEALRRLLPSRQPTPKEPESLYDALNRDGLIGCIKGGPCDLSTHPKYMKGFGRDHDTGTD